MNITAPAKVIPLFRTATQPPELASNTPTVDQLLDLYRREYLPSKAENTQIQAESFHKIICRDLGAYRLDALTPAVLRQWRDKLGKTYGTGSVRAIIYALSAALTIAVRHYDWLPSNPIQKIKLPPLAPSRERYLTSQERDKLLEACQRSQSPNLYLCVLLALTTGARKMELLSLRWSGVDLDKGLLRFARTKTGVRRVVPVTGLALRLLRDRAEQQGTAGLVFPSGQNAATTTIDKAFKVAVTRAGLRNFRFHDLRHTFASWAAMSGANAVELAELLGHSSMSMVRRYTHFGDSHLIDLSSRMTIQFLGEEGDQA